MALAAIELAAQFSRACGRNCFELSFSTLLHAVGVCCCGASEDTLVWLAAATGAGALIIPSYSCHQGLVIPHAPQPLLPLTTTGIRQVQLSVHHSFYESVRWFYAHGDAEWRDHQLVLPGIRPRDANLLVLDAQRRQPNMEACT